MLKVGQQVNFEMYDSLFEDYILVTGILVCRIYGRLWSIKPDANVRLSGSNVCVHENFISR